MTPSGRYNRAGMPILGRQPNGTFEGLWYIGLDEQGRLLFVNARGQIRKDTAPTDRY
jgi:hypothetical protein